MRFLTMMFPYFRGSLLAPTTAIRVAALRSRPVASSRAVIWDILLFLTELRTSKLCKKKQNVPNLPVNSGDEPHRSARSFRRHVPGCHRGGSRLQTDHAAAQAPGEARLPSAGDGGASDCG